MCLELISFKVFSILVFSINLTGMHNNNTFLYFLDNSAIIHNFKLMQKQNKHIYYINKKKMKTMAFL